MYRVLYGKRGDFYTTKEGVKIKIICKGSSA
jgi:hypothetical protein